MIKVTNKGKTVRIVERGNDFQQIVLSKDVRLNPKENFCIKANIVIECDSDLDECWVYSDKITDSENQEMLEGSELVGILTYRITKDDGEYKLEIDGGYVGENEFLLPKGTIIAGIHHSIKNNNKIDTKELNYKTLYQDEGVLVKAKDNYEGNFEIIINPDGTSYIRVNLPA